MTLRIGHIINLLFSVFIVLIAFNVLDFFYFWKGLPITLPTKIAYSLLAFYLLPKIQGTPNVPFQLWTIFVISFILIAYPVTLFYNEVHRTIAPPLLVRSLIYNYVVAAICYKFTLFAAQRGHLNRLVNGVLVAFIISSVITIFSFPIGFLTLQFVNQPAIVPFDRMAGLFLNPNLAGLAGNITMSLGLGILFRNEGSIGRALLGFRHCYWHRCGCGERFQNIYYRGYFYLVGVHSGLFFDIQPHEPTNTPFRESFFWLTHLCCRPIRHFTECFF